MLSLPLHPLVVHAAVVLIPLAALAFLLAGWCRTWRARYAGMVACLALAAALTSVIAVRSGDALKREVLRASAEAGVSAGFGDHPSYGRATQIAALTLAVGATLVWVCERRVFRSRQPPFWIASSYVIVSIPATAAVILVGLAGHSGGELVWRDLGSFPPAKVRALQDRDLERSAASTGRVPPGAIVVRMSEFRYDPPRLEASPGSEITLYVVNEGKVFHTLTILDARADTRPLWPKSSATLTFTAPERAGIYRFVCTEEGHQEEGMTGDLLVK